MYIHQLPDWPNFTWDEQKVLAVLAPVKFKQGRMLGRMSALGFSLREQALLKTLTGDVIKTSEIEGEILDPDQVRSSIARHLGMDVGGLVKSDRSVDGVVEMLLDATQHYADPLSEERLYTWHSALFKKSLSGMMLINVGMWRTDVGGPMQVVSGSQSREKIHFEAPSADLLPKEMNAFLSWFNQSDKIDLVLKAAIAHLWFVTIHPFDDGNGRIARAIADMALAQSEGQPERYYSMSSQIRLDRKEYYEQLESAQKKRHLDITAWLIWFLGCLDRAIDNAEVVLETVLNKSRFWRKYASEQLNKRQIEMLNYLFDGFKGKLSSSKWAKMTKCSQDTATRDINELIEKGILIKSAETGRSTNYLLRDFTINQID